MYELINNLTNSIENTYNSKSNKLKDMMIIPNNINYFLNYYYFIKLYLTHLLITILFQIRAITAPALYIQVLSLFLALKEEILKIVGIKFKPNGYIIDKAKLINVSSISIICVLVYTAQKQEIK